MSTNVDIRLVDLLLDGDNPRLSEPKQSQLDTAAGLAREHGDGIVRLAADIVENGTDPTTLTAVVATKDRHKRYRVLEGNRRVLALRALESPSLISAELSTASQKRLADLARRYALNPIETLPCVLFDSEDEADHWVRLRHTGENKGVGLVSWGSEEQDRYSRRHQGIRKPAGQVIEFVDKHGSLSDEAKTSRRRVITSLQRLLHTAYARDKLGVDVRGGQVVALYSTAATARSLSKIVDDLKSGVVTVPDLYHIGHRKAYIDGLPKSVLPKPSERLAQPVVLDDLTAGAATPRPAVATRPRRKKQPIPRTTVIPKSASLNVTPPRINEVFLELAELNAERYPNACSVLLRVLIELSVDHYVQRNKLLTEAQRRNGNLAKRLKLVAKDLRTKGDIQPQLERAISDMADGNTTVIGAKIPTFNQYVHNQYVFPRATDLYLSWNELEPFMEALWP
jgi:hypothetical protein